MTDTNITLCLTSRPYAQAADKAIKEGKATSRADLIRTALDAYFESIGYQVEQAKAQRKLTPDQVMDIVKRYQPRINGTDLALEYGITLSHLNHVVSRYKAAQEKSPSKRGRKPKGA